MEGTQAEGGVAGYESLRPGSEVEAFPSLDDVVEAVKKKKPPIVFDRPVKQPTSAVEEEREKHKARAKKFGTEYVEPSKELVMSRAALRTEISRARAGNRHGFVTGIDVNSEEEKAKREQRAHKFGAVSEPANGPALSPEESELLERRRQKFGPVEKPSEEKEGALMDVDALEERHNVRDGVAIRSEAVHVWGIDQMSTLEVRHMFREYGPSFVEWVNDSSCNVVFEDTFTAARALYGLGTPEVPTEAGWGGGRRRPVAAEAAHGGEEQEEEEEAEPVVAVAAANGGRPSPAPWFIGKPFEKGGLTLPIFLRLACVEDVKPIEGVASRYLWMQGVDPPGGGKRGQGRWRAGGRGERDLWEESREEGAVEEEAQEVPVDGAEEAYEGPSNGNSWSGRLSFDRRSLSSRLDFSTQQHVEKLEPDQAEAEGHSHSNRRKRRRERARAMEIDSDDHTGAADGDAEPGGGPEERKAGGRDLRDKIEGRVGRPSWELPPPGFPDDAGGARARRRRREENGEDRWQG